MTNYAVIERDFIKRTLEIIDQYEELVRQKTPESQQFEVTLLLNCLLGLLVYPQQLASDNEEGRFRNWLTMDRVSDVGETWGIRHSDVISPGYRWYKDKEVPITFEQLTMRNLLRQMRNTVAHARFKVDDTSMTGKITVLEFNDTSHEAGFHLVLPVERLETFVRALAESALKRLE